MQLVDGFVGTRHILESVGGHIFGELFGLVATDAQHAAFLHAGEEEKQQTKQQQHRQHERKHAHQEAVAGDVRVVFVDFAVLHRAKNLRGRTRWVLGNNGIDAFLLVHSDRLAQLQAQRLLTVVDLCLLDVFVLQLLQRKRSLHIEEVTGIVAPPSNGEQQHQKHGRAGSDLNNAFVFHESYLRAVHNDNGVPGAITTNKRPGAACQHKAGRGSFPRSPARNR